MAHRTPSQLANRRRVERAIRVAAPALDLLLFAGHHASRWAGRNERAPDPPRRSAGPGALRSRIGGSAGREPPSG